MARKPADEHIRELVKTGSGFVPVPEQTRDRVFAAIRQKAQTHAETVKPRRNIVRLFRYSPGIAAIAAAVIAIPVAVILWFALLARPAATGFVVASEKGGRIENRSADITPGTAIATGDVIVTRAHEQVSMYNGQALAVHVFSNTSLGIRKTVAAVEGGAREVAPDSFDFKLEYGTIYINKDVVKDAPPVEVTVRIDDYTFSLMGTRVLFAVGADRTITIICYKGEIRVDSAPAPRTGLPDRTPVETVVPGEIVKEAPPTIGTGIKVVISPAGLWSFIKEENWSEDENAVDRELRGNVSPSEFFREISFNTAGIIGSVDGKENLPPYSVSRIGSIAGTATASDKVNFFAAVQDNGRAWAVNQEAIFMIQVGNLVHGPALPAGTSTRVPISIGNGFVCVSTADSVILVDTSSSTVSTIKLPAEGSIDHGFIPRAIGKRLFVPVQNKGYFVVDLASPAAGLSLFAVEPFPVSPVGSGSLIVMGSYYNKTLFGFDLAAGVPATGASVSEKFRVNLEGGFFANPVSANNSIHVAIDSGSSAVIRRYSLSGEKTGSWSLPGGMTTDFVVSGKYVAGILGDGNLFILDTASGLVKKPARLFTRELSSRQQRSAGVLVKEGILFAGTDSGLVLAVDLANAQVLAEIRIGSEGIYVPCFTTDRDLYCIDNSGSVYRIVKNE